MNRLFSILLAAFIVAAPMALATGADAAAPQRDSHSPRHHSWIRGHRISETDRRRAASVDYRRYGLQTPPHSRRWVRIDNSFLLIGINSGLISKVVAAR
jgi:Ni/Co efflux regulator RcnB